MTVRMLPAAPILLPAMALAPLNVAGTAVALPVVADTLGTDPLALQWAVNAFNVAFAVCMLFAGVLADRFGPRPTFAIGLTVIVIAEAVSALALSLWVLDVGRALAGVGCAAVMAGGLALISRVYAEGAPRSRMFTLFGVVVGMALAFGPTVLGALTQALGWRGLYALLGAAALAALALTPYVPPGDRVRSGGDPVIDPELLRRAWFRVFALVPLIPAIGFVPIYTYLPVALSAVYGLSAAQAGAFMLPIGIPILLAPMVAARLLRGVAWFTPMKIVYVSCVCLVAGDLGMLLLGPALPVVVIVVPLVLTSVGYGLQMGLVDAQAIAAVPARSSGTAAGLVNFVRTGSAAVTVTLYGVAVASLLAIVLPPDIAAEVAAGGEGHAQVYSDAFAAVALLAAGGAIALSGVIGWLHWRARRSGAPAADGGA